MHKVILILLASTFFMATSAFSEEQASLKDKVERYSYAIGISIGNKINQQGIDINTDLLMKGLKDGLSGGRGLLNDAEYVEVLTTLSKEVTAKQEEEMKKLGDKNKLDGQRFLDENKKKEGVKTLTSGLQYKVIKEGKGKIPKATDTVTVHYQGTLIDGNEFDSSIKRGEPATFPVDGVIRGWTEALQLMKEGAKWQLFIPSDLAYGEKGAGNVIGPNETLIFDVELISIEKSENK